MRCRGGQRGRSGWRVFFERKWRFNIWSLLDWACHVHSVPRFSIVASHNCGGGEKSEKSASAPIRASMSATTATRQISRARAKTEVTDEKIAKKKRHSNLATSEANT